MPPELLLDPNAPPFIGTYLVVDSVSVSDHEDHVRVDVTLTPGNWGWTQGQINLNVPKDNADGLIRQAACDKIRRDAGITLLPTDLRAPFDVVPEPTLKGSEVGYVETVRFLDEPEAAPKVAQVADEPAPAPEPVSPPTTGMLTSGKLPKGKHKRGKR